MILAGLVLLVAGGVVALAADGAVAGVDLTVAGGAVMGVGAGVLIAGLLRLRRRPAGPGGEPYRTGKGKIVAMVAAVLYIVSPVDLVPDFLLPVGVVDDATALTWLVIAAGQELARRRRRPLGGEGRRPGP
ncbi:YkvA family protein [Spirillospora sp. NPDC029432]|uniref:YkvA family protein n=1 Tax=Spirillospora sp. NPDC029432 TaxID=3154599 RepID=UPI0034556C2C